MGEFVGNLVGLVVFVVCITAGWSFFVDAAR